MHRLTRASGFLGLYLGVFYTLSATAAPPQTLHGHVPAVVARLQAIDRLPGTNQLRLAIGLPLRNPEALTNLLRQLYDSTSAGYHRFLTPEQFAERFAPTEQDYQAARDFASAHGLAVVGVHPNRAVLDVRGAVTDVERALGVTLRTYQHPTEARLFYAPDTEPSVELGTRLLHVGGLNNYTLPRPRMRELVANPAVAAGPRVGSGPSGAYRGNDFRSAYLPDVTATGTGQSVGLFELDGYYATDIATYESQAGLPSVPLQNVLIDGFSGNPTSSRRNSGNEEVALDIEMVACMAPGVSQILVYEGSPTSTAAVTDDMLNRMATDNLAKQLSCSWGFDIDAISQQVFLQYAAQGQSFFLASGDNGAFGAVVEQPSDDPYITVVGGTSLTTSGSQAWVSETTWNGSGGGISSLYPIPSWQQGISMTANKGSTAMRNAPDVAMVASNVWVIADRGRSFPVVGTSIAAPLWAALTALVNQQAAANGKPPVGFLNPALYAIGKNPATTHVFHDITFGNNFTSSSPNLYPAVAGYDLCTGWGTPTGAPLINALLNLLPADGLVINSPLGFLAHGAVGGPFNVTSQTYTLTNAGAAPLTWSAGSADSWLQVSPASGSLTRGGPAATTTVSLAPSASALLIGSFTTTVTFTNLTDGTTQTRQFILQVGNGGFEDGDLSNWNLSGSALSNYADSIDTSQLAGGQTIPGIDDSQFVHSGIFGAFLGQGVTIGALSQTIPTNPGQTFTLSFWLTNPAPGTPNSFRALWNGSALYDKLNVGAFGWTKLQYTVTATGSSATLQFQFRNDQNAFGLDDVIVQAIPSTTPISQPVLQTSVQGNGQLVLTWSSTAGVNYQVQFSTGLTTGAWSNLGGLMPGTGGTLTASDPLGGAGLRFYRVVATE